MPKDMPQFQGLQTKILNGTGGQNSNHSQVHKNTNTILKCTITRGLLAPKRLKRHLGVNSPDKDTLQACAQINSKATGGPKNSENSTLQEPHRQGTQ